MKRILVIAFLAGIVLGCRPSLYIPASADAAEQEKLLAGRTLYAERCSSCHNLHFPQEFSADEWRVKVSAMQQRAKLTDDQKALIINYLANAK